jgi:DNA-binding HxlR family transcriptional regulator
MPVPTTRSYRDGCGIARALDAVGERWALLVVRELLLGGQRFTDLRHALPGVSANLLTDRLRELEANGVVGRRTLSPPSASVVYELTESGRELEPIILALGQWGLRMPVPADRRRLSATSVLLYLRGVCRPEPAEPPAVLAVELDGRTWTVATSQGTVTVDSGEPPSPDAHVRTDPETLNAILADPRRLEEALDDRTLIIDGGDPAIVQRHFSVG